MAGIIDILAIEPHKVNRSISGKYLLVYGSPKVGKTTFCAKDIPKTLLCAFEKGYNAIPGIKKVDLDDWSTLKTIVRQLETPEAKATYENVCIDTVAIASQACADYICRQYGVQTLTDINRGQGWNLYRNEMSSLFRKITKLGYGVAFIAHEKETVIKGGKDDEATVRRVSPDLDKKATEVLNGLVDFTLYIKAEWENGESKRYFYARETPLIMAGSRFKHIAPKIPFGYESLADAIAEAIRAEEEENPGAVVNGPVEDTTPEKRPFVDVMEEAGRLWNALPSTDEWKKRKQLAVKEYFGEFMKLSSATEDQQDLVEGVISELKIMLDEHEKTK